MTPKLRFQGFHDKWATFKLKEVAEIVTGSTPPTSDKTNYGGSYLFLSPADINSGDIIDSSKKLSLKGWQWVRQIPLDSVVFVCIGSTIGKCGIVKRDFSTNQQINSLIPNEDIDTTFLYSLLLKNASKIKKLAGVQAVPQLNKSVFSALRFNFPSYPEQEKIGLLITSLDNKINLLTKKKEALETYKKGLMQKIFSQGFRFKREDGTDYPDWEWIALEDILDYEQPTKYIVSSTEYDDSYNTPVLTAGKTFVLGYTNEANGIFSQTPIILFDDFTTDFKFVNFPFKVKSSAAKILKLKRSADMLYVHEAMHTIKFPRGEHKRYWISEFSKMEIPFPTLDEQIKFSALIQSTNAMLEVNEKLLRSSSRLKKGLLQQMFV